jgi:hypothetical protein
MATGYAGQILRGTARESDIGLAAGVSEPRRKGAVRPPGEAMRGRSSTS